MVRANFHFVRVYSIKLQYQIVFAVSLILLSPVNGITEDCQKAQKFVNLGKKLLNYEERRDAFRKAVELCPSLGEAHQGLAEALENLSEYRNAEDHYRKALDLRNDIPASYIGLGELYLKTGRFSLARDIFVEGRSIVGDDPRLDAGLKLALERLNRERGFFTAPQIGACLVQDEDFRLMCMCPVDRARYLRKWICLPPVFFAAGSSWLRPQAERQLDEIGQAMKSPGLGGKSWLITGHADALGPEQANLDLSEERANRVKRYLVNRHKVPADSMKTIFFGHSLPRANNSTSKGRGENRRVEIILEE
jgi:tetratricopeptide (TPR) repeat protein